MDNMIRARQIYRDEHRGVSFPQEDAWQVLRSHKKWDAPEPVDLTGNVPSQTNEVLFSHDRKPRPMGKILATKKAKFETTVSTWGASTVGTSSSSQFREFMTYEICIKREAVQEAYEAAKEKDCTIMKLEEMKFLGINTKKMDANTAYWIKMEKEKIIKKNVICSHKIRFICIS